MKVLITTLVLGIVAIMLSACPDTQVSGHQDTGCITTSDSTRTCDGEEFQLYY